MAFNLRNRNFLKEADFTNLEFKQTQSNEIKSVSPTKAKSRKHNGTPIEQ